MELINKRYDREVDTLRVRLETVHSREEVTCDLETLQKDGMATAARKAKETSSMVDEFPNRDKELELSKLVIIWAKNVKGVFCLAFQK